MKGLFIILLIIFSALLSVGCGSKAAENINMNAAVENANVNTNINNAPIASEPVPVFDNAETALSEGNKYFDAGATEKSIEAYKQAVALNPEYAEAFYRLGIAYLLLESEQEADRLPGEVTEPTPKSSKGKKKEPEKTNAEKAFGNAVKLYEKVVKKDTEDDAAFFYLGRSYNKLNEDDKAAKALRQAVKLKPDNGEYQTELAESLINIAEYDEAVRALKKALEIDENNLQAEDLLEKAQAGQKRIEFGKKQIQQKMEQQMQQEQRPSTDRPRRSRSDPANDTPSDTNPKPDTTKKPTANNPDK